MKSTITPEQANAGTAVLELKRKIVFVNGAHLNLRNVTRIVTTGTWWRVWSDEGLNIIDPNKVLYATIDGQ